MGRDASGVQGMKLRAGDEVIAVGVAQDDADLLVVTENGYGKRTRVTEYPVKGRGGMGVKTVQLTEARGHLAGARVVREGYQVMMISTGGTVIRMAGERHQAARPLDAGRDRDAAPRGRAGLDARARGRGRRRTPAVADGVGQRRRAGADRRSIGGCLRRRPLPKTRDKGSITPKRGRTRSHARSSKECSVAAGRQVDLLEPINLAEHLGKVELYLGQVCQIAGISKMQLDYWTNKAQIPTKGRKQRIYDIDALETVMLIKQAKDKGLNLGAAIDAARRSASEARPRRGRVARLLAGFSQLLAASSGGTVFT